MALASHATPELDVLLVEDNPGDVELVREAVVDLGVALSVVQDGEQALAYLRRLPPFDRTALPQLVLLDLKLPRLGGLEVLEQVDRDAELRRVPVVVFTSSQAPQDLSRAYELNARACFAKPGTGMRDLLTTVIEFVRNTLPIPQSRSPTAITPPEAPVRTRPEEVQRWRELAGIVDSAADAIIGTDVDDTITSWNRAAETLYGHGAAEAIGRHLGLIVPAERLTELDQIMNSITAGEPLRHLRTVRVTQAGREVNVDLTISPVHDSHGNLIGKSAIARDVSEQVLAEERFRLAVEASPSAMLMVDAEGKIVMLNAEAERLFGYQRAELIGGELNTLIPERFRQAHPGHRQAFMGSPQARAMGVGRELYGLRKDGTEVPVEIGLNPIETTNGTFVLNSIVDITERRQAEEKFRLAVEASPSGIVMVDSAGTIVLVNAQTQRMFGYAREELIGSSVDRLVPKRFRGQHAHNRRSFAAAAEARSMGIGRDLYGLRKDGSEFPVEVGLTPIDTDAGRLVLSTILDITARKRSEEALSAQAMELSRSNDELEQFAYVASHDMQEPLRMVSSYTELLAERYAGQLDDKARRYIHYAQDGAERMRAMIDDLLVYSRVRTRGGDLVEINARDAFARALANLQVPVREARANIEANIDVQVLGDEAQLSQVFQNLLSNALKFSGDGEPEISVSARRAGANYVFAVRDNGIGIAPEYSERIFQMFERLHTRDEYAGTGIGLALCRRIIERHQGTIWMESDGANGSTFFFTLKAP